KAKLAKGKGGGNQREVEQTEREAAYDGHYLSEAKELEALAGTGGTEAQKAAIEDWYGGDWDDDGNLFHVVNPDAKWDWYVVGGRWSGYFKLKAGATGGLGEPGAFKNKPEFDADVCRVKDIDWEGMKAVQRKKAEERWTAYQDALTAGKKIIP